MNEYEDVEKVECKEDKCIVFHDGIESEVDVDGIMLKGKSVVRGAETEVEFENGKCKKYDGVLICKKGGEW